MYKLIVSDMDETLLNDQREICQRNIDCIRKAREKGVKFVLATGRGIISIQDDLKVLGLYDQKDEYILPFNGGALVENKDNRLLFFQGLSFEKIKEIFEYGLKCDVCIHIHTKDQLYVYRLKESQTEFRRQNGQCVIMDEDTIDFLKEEALVKIVYQNTDIDYLMSLKPKMRSIWENECEVSFSSNKNMEFNALGVNKGAGLLKLANILGIDISKCIAVGDNDNDISMLKVAGLSVAGANAVDDVKALCDVVTEADHNEGVIAEIIERYIL